MSQHDFWKGEFGDRYIERNNTRDLRASNLILFSTILNQTKISPLSILEVGANIGLNVEALKQLLPNCNFTGIEINGRAAKLLEKTGAKVLVGSIEETSCTEKYDLVFSKGVLIHINPDSLNLVYEKMYEASNRWILTIEYYSRNPSEITYRGQRNVLFKRDFSGDLMDKYGEKLRLVDYGFVYHRDIFPQDDLNWFLLEKQ